jgi:hypothetical protein
VAGCGKCDGNPPKGESPSAENAIVRRIEELIQKENAGHLDKNLLEYYEWRLMEIWREAEAQQERNYKAHVKTIFEVTMARLAG